MPITKRPQRRAALQASQQLAYAAVHGPSFGPNEETQQFASHSAVVQEGNQWYRSEREEGKGSALEEWRERRVKRRLVDLERTNAHDLPSTAFPLASRPASDVSTSPSRRKHTSASPAPTNTSHPPGYIPQSVVRQRQRADKRRKAMTPSVRTLIQYRKTLREYLNELPPTTPYLTQHAPFPTHPPRKTCSSCAHPEGKYACERCGEYACSMECWRTHREIAVGDGGCGVGMQGTVGFAV
ncbi:hypothetical protein NCC49_000369 [Naganishia albida]|nr:hypothetical protein NCC49_000369 [Naganishia albida]